MNKKIISKLFVVIGISSILSGCTTTEGNVKKIVLENNINDNANKQLFDDIKKISGVETLNLELKEGDYFAPSFYHNGELYGYISRGEGISENLSKVEYPVEGSHKGYLYKLTDDNALEETNKEVVTLPVIGSDSFYRANENDEVYSMDYSNKNNPELVVDLSGYIKELRMDYAYRMKNDNSVEKYLSSSYEIGGITDSEYLRLEFDNNIFIYDIEKGFAYRHRDGELEGSIIYIDDIGYMICVDKEQNISKVILDGEEFYLESLIELGKVMQNINLNIIGVNGEELIFEDRQKLEIGKKYSNEIEETLRISKYNIRTNKVTTLFEKKEGTNVVAKYIGDNIFMIDSFNIEDGVIVPKDRNFYEITEGKVNQMYKENIEDEKRDGVPKYFIELSEDKREIFLAKYITERDSGIDSTIEAIYKKYTFE